MIVRISPKIILKMRKHLVTPNTIFFLYYAIIDLFRHIEVFIGLSNDVLDSLSPVYHLDFLEIVLRPFLKHNFPNNFLNLLFYHLINDRLVGLVVSMSY